MLFADTITSVCLPRRIRAKRLDLRQYRFGHITLWSRASHFTLISSAYAFPACCVPLYLSATGKPANQLDFSPIQHPLRGDTKKPLRAHIDVALGIGTNKRHSRSTGIFEIGIQEVSGLADPCCTNHQAVNVTTVDQRSCAFACGRASDH